MSERQVHAADRVPGDAPPQPADIARWSQSPVAEFHSSVFIPVLRREQFRFRSRSKNDLENDGQRCSRSAFNAVHVTPFRRS
jgi:hypothetical protein